MDSCRRVLVQLPVFVVADFPDFARAVAELERLDRGEQLQFPHLLWWSPIQFSRDSPIRAGCRRRMHGRSGKGTLSNIVHYPVDLIFEAARAQPAPAMYNYLTYCCCEDLKFRAVLTGE